MRRLLYTLALPLYLTAGCDARFVDLAEPTPATPGPGPSPDLGGSTPQPGPETVLAAGTFVGRAGHAGRGDGELHRLADGSIEVRFAANFGSSGVPGPVVFLTSRQDMGSSIDMQADVNLGTLKSPSGAQSYAVPAGAEVGRRNVFVYCQPFRVEVAKAALVDR